LFPNISLRILKKGLTGLPHLSGLGLSKCEYYTKIVRSKIPATKITE
jgi:hypothetical protein